MRTRKLFLFICAACALSLLLGLGTLLGLDLYLHKRFERVAGLNIRGYRGQVVGRKQPGERRVIILGGSTALGYGVPPEEAFPVYLERKLNEQHRQAQRGRVSVVNIAGNSEGAYAFLYNLRAYEYLNADVAVFYTGYNDLGRSNTQVLRRQSPVFRLTGYYPILPLILREKVMALRYGNVEAGYRAEYGRKKVIFKPAPAQRPIASALEAAISVTQALERQLGHLSSEPKVAPTSVDLGCGQWSHYCQSLYKAVDYALSRGKWAFVVTEPYISDEHIEQQGVMANMLRDRFGAHPRLRSINLGRVVDLGDPALCYDGMHLTAKGNERIAEALVQPLLSILD